MSHLGAMLGLCWGHVGPMLGHLAAILGLCWAILGHLGAMLGLSWAILGLILACWGYVGAMLGQGGTPIFFRIYVLFVEEQKIRKIRGYGGAELGRREMRAAVLV